MGNIYYILGLEKDPVVHREYLTRQLIAYIGNKRRLLGFFGDVFAMLEKEHKIRLFADPFAGSGSVSRLARSRGYRVSAGDLEEYSRLLVSAAVILSPGEAEELLSPYGGFDLYAELQEYGASDSPPTRPFISRFYSPADTDRADYRRERLFYTRENGLFIDRVRQRIEELIPGNPGPENGRLRLAKDLMTAPLLYEAATRVNTSGVFKAFHKGFGGHGRDALGRILSPIQLQLPVLVDGAGGSEVKRCDALTLLSNTVFDLCYIDPPYNQHQYGSNYHLLNTIALWDNPPIDNMLDETGRLCRRAGIRPDWKNTRSGFCSAAKAREEFAALMEVSDGRLMAVSYSTDGIVPVEELFALFERYGRTSIYTSDYTVYRGGRQSPTKAGKNLELLFVVDRSSRAPAGGEGRAELRRVLGIRKASRLIRESFVPARLSELFSVTGEWVDLAPDLRLKSDRLYRFPILPEKGALEALRGEVLESLAEKLEQARCRDRQEECAVLRDLIAVSSSPTKSDEAKLLSALRTLVHRKYAGIWEEELRKSRILAESDPCRFEGLAAGLSKLEELAGLRFSG